MGFYIETDSNKNKADWILNNCKGASDALTSFQQQLMANHDSIPVVVVDNGPFEAAAIAFDKEELKVFTDPDDYRPKRYLLVPKTDIIRLQPKVEAALNWPKI